MNVKIISEILCEYMNNICQVEDEENQVIKYGMELLLETLLKIIFLILLGMLFGKAFETLIILSTFCGFRSQAGGKHARTNLGCTGCMVLIWKTSLFGYLNFKISGLALGSIYIFSLFITLCCAPKSGNLIYFTKERILKKKICSVLLLTTLMFISYLNVYVRELLVYPIIWEVLSLLPANKIKKTGER